jgi:hypothetical protein
MAFEGFDATHFEFAGGTLVKELAFAGAAGEGQGVAGTFVGNAEIGAGLAPFVAVGFNTAASGAGISDEVGDLMFEGAHDLAFEAGQFGVEFDHPLWPLRITGGASQAGIPVNLKPDGTFVLTEIIEPLTGLLFENGVATWGRIEFVGWRG